MQPQKPANPNRDREWRERNKQNIIQRVKKWQQEHPEQTRVNKNKYAKSNRGRIVRTKFSRLRIARKIGNVPYEPFTPDDIFDLFVTQEYQCFYCKCDIRKAYHIDHYIPLAKGGSHSLANIVLACPTCNCRKGAKMPEDFTP